MATDGEHTHPLHSWELPALLLVTAVGAMARFWLLPRVPGLWYDEAINGLDALRVMREAGWPLFFDTGGHVREPLYIYLEVFGIRWGGTTAVALRAVSAVIGTLTIPVVWLLAREYRGPLFAAGVAALFALLRWHITFSALAFRTILAPLFAALVLLFLLRVLRTRRWSDAVLCGAFLGAGAYTYLAFRLMPLAILPPLFLAWWQARGSASDGGTMLLKRYGALAGAAAFVFAPLAVHFARTPEHFTGRSDEVTLSQHGNPALLIARQARDVALMPLLRGDHVGKHNLPGPPRVLQLIEEHPDRVAELWHRERQYAAAENRPIYDPHGTGVPALSIWGGILFYIGLFLVLRNCRRSPADLALVSVLGIGSLASVLSFGAPNMLRLLMLTPVVVIVLGRAFEWLMVALWARKDALWKRVEDPAQRDWRHKALVGGIVLWVALFHIQAEVGRVHRWLAHPMVHQEFNVEWADMGHYLELQPDRLAVRLPFDPHRTLQFLADGYTFNPPVEELGEVWWEFRTEPPFPPLEPLGEPVHEARRFRVMHPAGLPMGELVEVQAGASR